MELTIPKNQLEAIRRSILKKTEDFDRIIQKALQRHKARPEIVCLCGSTRFADAFWDVGWELTLQGKIVLTINVVRWCEDHAGEKLAPEVCDMLDELHLCKIDMANSIKVINVGGYIGESTSVEVSYAEFLGKPITYLED